MFNARVIFDGGMQRSYITHELKDPLNLPVLKRDLLLIKTFGSDKETLQECELVQVALKGLNNDLVTYLTLHAVPKICAPIQDQRIEIVQELYPYLQGIILADGTCDSPELNIQILIGSDLYGTLVTGNVIRGPPGSNGPVALETQVAYI